MNFKESSCPVSCIISCFTHGINLPQKYLPLLLNSDNINRLGGWICPQEKQKMILSYSSKSNKNDIVHQLM